MNAADFLTALNEADDEYVWQALHSGRGAELAAPKKKSRLLRRALLAAAAVLILTASVYGAGELIGLWNDRWLQTPAPDPTQVVREALSRQIEKEYTRSVTVDALLPDREEAQRFAAWQPDTMLAILNGFGAKPKALEGKQPEEVEAVYARYTVEYDHTKTFYTDGTLYQYFYLVRDAAGNWEIIETSAAQELNPVLPVDDGSGSDPSEAPADSDRSAAIAAVTELVSGWAAELGTVNTVAYDPARTAAARQRLQGTVLARGNGWSDAYLKAHMAAVTVRYTTQNSHPREESTTYWLLQDPLTGTWHGSELTAIMQTAEAVP